MAAGDFNERWAALEGSPPTDTDPESWTVRVRKWVRLPLGSIQVVIRTFLFPTFAQAHNAWNGYWAAKPEDLVSNPAVGTAGSSAPLGGQGESEPITDTP